MPARRDRACGLVRAKSAKCRASLRETLSDLTTGTCDTRTVAPAPCMLHAALRLLVRPGIGFGMRSTPRIALALAAVVVLAAAGAFAGIKIGRTGGAITVRCPARLRQRSQAKCRVSRARLGSVPLTWRRVRPACGRLASCGGRLRGR